MQFEEDKIDNKSKESIYKPAKKNNKIALKLILIVSISSIAMGTALYLNKSMTHNKISAEWKAEHQTFLNKMENYDAFLQEIDTEFENIINLDTSVATIDKLWDKWNLNDLEKSQLGEFAHTAAKVQLLKFYIKNYQENPEQLASLKQKYQKTFSELNSIREKYEIPLNLDFSQLSYDNSYNLKVTDLFSDDEIEKFKTTDNASIKNFIMINYHTIYFSLNAQNLDLKEELQDKSLYSFSNFQKINDIPSIISILHSKENGKFNFADIQTDDVERVSKHFKELIPELNEKDANTIAKRYINNMKPIRIKAQEGQTNIDFFGKEIQRLIDIIDK